MQFINLHVYKRFHEVVPVRYVVSLLSFFFGFHVFALRSVTPISLLAMTKSVQSNTSVSDCPFPEGPNITITNDTPEYSMDVPEFNWDQKQQGLVLSSYFIGIALTQVLGGVLSNYFTSKWLTGAGLLTSAVLTNIAPSAAYAGYGQFLTVWFLVGISSGISMSPIYSLLSRWAPVRERGVMYSILFVGFTVGSVVSQIASGYIISGMDAEQDGWKYPYYIFGSFACLWFVFWSLLIADSPLDHPAISEEERRMLTEELGDLKQNKNDKIPWFGILTSVPFWAMVCADAAAHWHLDFFQTQIPNFMTNVLHQAIYETGLFASLPLIVYSATSFLSGTITKWLHFKFHLSTNFTRKLFMCIALYGGGAALLGVGYQCDVILNLMLLTVSMGFAGATTSGTLCTPADMSPKFSGVVFGISNTISSLCAFICPALVGYIVSGKENLQSWREAFLIDSCLSFVTCTIFLFLGSSQLQPWSMEDENSEESETNSVSNAQNNTGNPHLTI